MSEALHQACDACRIRKHRCKMSTADRCEFCLSRNKDCCFSFIKKRRKRKLGQSEDPSAQLRFGNEGHKHGEDLLEHSNISTTTLYIDSLLADRPASRISGSAKRPDQLTAIFGPNHNISFFPAKRVRSISERLGHDRLEQLLADIRDIVAAKVQTSFSVSHSRDLKDFNSRHPHNFPHPESLGAHILVYFETVHPIYPFLCAAEFQRQAASPDLSNFLSTDKAFAALYYAIVAIGCQHNEGGSYEAGIGDAWSYFRRSLSHFQDLILARGSLTAVQALIAMVLREYPLPSNHKNSAEVLCQAIFSSTACAFQFDSLIISQAAIMAQDLGYNRSNGAHEVLQRRTFWVLYFMEKVSCFTTGKVSVLQDSNISCAIPDVQESTFDDYDWFFGFLRYARLVSKIRNDFLQITSLNQSASEYITKGQGLLKELESWRLSIPERFRAGVSLKTRLLREPLAQRVALMTHYMYFHALLTLSWSLLHSSAIKVGPMQEQLDLKRSMMRTARSVLELTKFIEVAPSTPVWILAVLPLSCLMILFDLVVHNPDHPEVSLSLALLDIAGGHFSRLEFASNGTLPGSLVAQFAHLARQYISEKRVCKQKLIGISIPDPSNPVQFEVPGGPTDSEMLPSSSRLSAIGVTTSNQSAEALSGLHEQLTLNSTATPTWNSNFLSESDALFIPFIDDPSYRNEDLELLGTDLKDLFDYSCARW